MQMNLELELSSNRKHDLYMQANFEEILFEVHRTVL